MRDIFPYVHWLVLTGQRAASVLQVIGMSLCWSIEYVLTWLVVVLYWLGWL